jgi:DoxX-like protein
MDSSPKKNVVAYWTSTVLAALLSAIPGAALLLRVPHFTNDMAQLGYPSYFLTILGVWKLLGALAIVVPGLPRLKEWAYAGMIFDLSSAAISRTVAGNDPVKILPPLLVAVIVILSWRLRPIGRAWRMASPAYGEQS